VKKFEAVRGKEGVVRKQKFRNELDEISWMVNDIEAQIQDGVRPCDISIITKKNKTLELIGKALLQKNIPVNLSKDESIFESDEISLLIHILCLLSRKIALFNLVEHVKARSSKWIKTQGEEFSNFYWQDGYGAFSVSETHTEKLIDYIKFQKKHHQQKNFENEILEILRKNKVDFDEKYLFD
jgi:superfamily I DNA/RNA helicase